MGPRPEWETPSQGAQQELAVQGTIEPSTAAIESGTRAGANEQDPRPKAVDLNGATPDKDGVSDAVPPVEAETPAPGQAADAILGSSELSEAQGVGTALCEELWGSALTWDATALLHPFALLGTTFNVIMYMNQTSFYQTALFFSETEAESKMYYLVRSICLGASFLPWIAVYLWVCFCGFGGFASPKWAHLIASLTTVVLIVETGVLRRKLLIGLLAIIVFGVIGAGALPGGKRRMNAVRFLMFSCFFQIGAWAFNKYIPPNLNRLPAFAGAVGLPLMALTYEALFPPLIFWCWRQPSREGTPDILLSFSVAMVRYVAEGLYLGGLITTIHKNSEDRVWLFGCASILCRCGSKFLGRIGFWDMIRGRLFGQRFNNMSAERDLVGRCSTVQPWILMIGCGSLLMGYGILSLHAVGRDALGSPYFGGVFHRPSFWAIIFLAAAAAVLSEFGVAVFVWKLRGGSGNRMSIWQTFRSLHKPGMQSLIGSGQWYNDHLRDSQDSLVNGCKGCKEMSNEVMPGPYPCAPKLQQLSLLMIAMLYLPLQLGPFPPMNFAQGQMG